ncbi:MAG: hypothetical protein M1831_002377 [Alyxoria varia]|nr:MAG: hypothetical protein M1831_002377 [Alyxoria varia]
MRYLLFWGLTLSIFGTASTQVSSPAPHDWTTQCKTRVIQAYEAQHNGTPPSSPALGLVDSSGSLIPGLTPNDAWGITFRECERTCQDITRSFDFGNFAAAVTSWLFQWLALVAQLPYETSGSINNAKSALMAVGSPALITYSLAISMANRVRVSARINDVVRKADRDDHILRTLKEQARHILLETQQEPVRAWEGKDAALSSLILRENNQKWWSRSQENLKNTQRNVTISLIAQMLFAVIAWLFTIIASFDMLGDPTVALYISSSSIWLWMVPVVTGWIAVGTQSRKEAVKDALSNKVRCVRERPSLSYDGTSLNPTKGRQAGIIATFDFLEAPQPEDPTGRDLAAARGLSNGQESFDVGGEALPSIRMDVLEPYSPAEPTSRGPDSSSTTPSNGKARRRRTNHAVVGPSPLFQEAPCVSTTRSTVGGGETSGPSSFQYPNLVKVESLWGFPFTGHESEEGPVFNFARVFTYDRFAEIVIQGFESATQKIASGYDPYKYARTSAQISEFCGYGTDRPMQAYPNWHEIPAQVWQGILVASAAAMFVQWGTTGPSIMQAILTPVA